MGGQDTEPAWFQEYHWLLDNFPILQVPFLALGISGKGPMPAVSGDLRDLMSSKGYLPPYLGSNPADLSQPRSPYPVSLSAIIQLTSWSVRRRAILEGLLGFRGLLKQQGFTRGIQWLDGSFVEHCEETRQKDPNDLDVVTWIPVENMDFFNTKVVPQLPNQAQIKKDFLIDAYFAPCTIDGWLAPDFAIYWSGLFGHTRGGDWKGILSIDLSEDEPEGIPGMEENP